MSAPAWALKLVAVAFTAATLGGAFEYAATHVKNPLAPLQPPVADRSPEPVEVAVELTPSPTLVPTAAPTRSPALPTGATEPSARAASAVRPTFLVTPVPPTPAPRTPTPTLTLAAAVRATKLPAISNTHSS